MPSVRFSPDRSVRFTTAADTLEGLPVTGIFASRWKGDQAPAPRTESGVHHHPEPVSPRFHLELHRCNPEPVEGSALLPASARTRSRPETPICADVVGGPLCGVEVQISGQARNDTRASPQ